jgi:hypothetical protein
MDIFQISILVHQSMYKLNNYCALIRSLMESVPTIFFGGVNHLELATTKNAWQVST